MRLCVVRGESFLGVDLYAATLHMLHLDPPFHLCMDIVLTILEGPRPGHRHQY